MKLASVVAALAFKIVAALVLGVLTLALALLKRLAAGAVLFFGRLKDRLKDLRLPEAQPKDRRRYSVEIDGARYTLMDLSRSGFCAEGDIDAAPQRAMATVFRDDAPVLRSEVAQIWRGDRDAKYRFVGASN